MARTHRDPSLGRNVAREPAAAVPPTAATAGETVDAAPVVETVTQPAPLCGQPGECPGINCHLGTQPGIAPQLEG